MAGMTEKQAESLDLVYGLEDKAAVWECVVECSYAPSGDFCPDDYSGTDSRRGVGAAG